jgi:hypothetical protein
MGERTAPGVGAASAGTSTALERSGFVLVSLILVAPSRRACRGLMVAA